MRSLTSTNLVSRPVLAATMALVCCAASHGAVTVWTGGASGNNWSEAGNWTDGVPGAGDTAEFDYTTTGGASGIVTNLVDSSITLETLAFPLRAANPSGFYHTAQIAPDTTILLTNALQIVPRDDSVVITDNTTVDVTVTGGQGSVLQVGNTGTKTANVKVAYNRDVGSRTLMGTLDLSGLETFVAHVDTFEVALSRQRAAGIVTLASNNTIHANTIRLGQSVGTRAPETTTLVLGSETTEITANDFYVSEGKSTALVTFGPGGGTFTLGAEDARVNLWVGHHRAAGTDQAHHQSGTVDLSGGTFNAFIDRLVIGYVQNNRRRSGMTGKVIFTEGTLNANDVILSEWVDDLDQNPGEKGEAVGTFEFRGGTLQAGSIRKGDFHDAGKGDVAVFDWTGGTLHVGIFGAPGAAFDLEQKGGTLAPGTPSGTTTIYGDYTQSAGTLEIEIAGPDEHDFVMVYGDAAFEGYLDVRLPGTFAAELGHSFDVLQTTGDLTVDFADILGDAPTSTFGWWDVSAVSNPGGDGHLLRLSAVPEPTAAMLTLLALAGLLGCVRPRRR